MRVLAQAAVAETLGVELLRLLFRSMLEQRKFELKVQELYKNGQLPGFVHLYLGEEAVAAGVCAALEPKDLVFSTHRGHGHALAKGVPAHLVMAELFGRQPGPSAGRGGSMHLYAPEYGFMGTNGVVGACIPLATGAALSAQLRRTSQVAVCFFGDGAVNSGSFHEAVNLGAVWNLPVVYICENNLYATEMAFARATRNTSVASRAAAYGLRGIEVDGNDVVAVHEAAAQAVRRARSGEGPVLLECKTYRLAGHHEGDPGTSYRAKDEIEAWKQRCPLKLFRERFEEYVGMKWLEEIDSELERHIELAGEYARNSPQPDQSSVLDNSIG